MESYSSPSNEPVALRTLLRVAATALTLVLSVACSKQPAPSEPDAAELEALASLNSCQQRIAKWQQLQAAVTSANVAERIAQLRKAAQAIGEDPEGCTANLIDGALSDELRKVLVLKIGDKEFPAGVVYTCRELREGTKCAGRIADDTALLGEAPDSAAVLPATSAAQVIALAAYPVASLQWYQALDTALLDNPAAAVLVAPKPDGTVPLPAASESNVIFAIGKSPVGEIHKWVWLVR